MKTEKDTKTSIDKVKKNLIETAGLLASNFNFSPIVGQIYALLYLSPDPVSLDDMVKELNISKGSASTNIRALESWGAVKRVLVRGSRKDNYTVNTNIESLIISRIKSGIKKRLEDVAGQITKTRKELADISNAEFYSTRISKAEEAYNKLMYFLTMLPD